MQVTLEIRLQAEELTAGLNQRQPTMVAKVYGFAGNTAAAGQGLFQGDCSNGIGGALVGTIGTIGTMNPAIVGLAVAGGAIAGGCFKNTSSNNGGNNGALGGNSSPNSVNGQCRW